MMKKYVKVLANQMGVEISKINLTDGRLYGCKDGHMLDIHTENESTSTVVFQNDISKLETGDECLRLETKIRAALSRLSDSA